MTTKLTALCNRSFIKTLCLIGIIWSAHWLIIQIYSYLCAPEGFYGFLKSFLLLGSPTCQFLNYIQYHLSTNYIAILTASGISILALLR